MKSGPLHRGRPHQPGKRARNATHPARLRPGSEAAAPIEVVSSPPAAGDIVPRAPQGHEHGAVGWAYAVPPRLSTGPAKYRIVIDCVFDRRKPGTDE